MQSADSKGYALTWSELAKQYPPDKFIHVLPASDMLFATPRPDYRLDVAIVEIPPTKQFVYPIEKKNVQVNNEWVETWISVGLLKAALERIISAAEVSAVPRRVDDRSDPLLATYEACAVMLGPTGAVRTRGASKSWKGELARERKQLEAEKKMQRYVSKGWKLDGGKKASAATQEERDAQVALWFREDWIREREFGPETAESKAVGRAVRALLGIPAKFDPAELEQKRFLIPRWVFDPDVTDPAIRALVVTAGLNARMGVFAMNALQSAAPEVKMIGPAPATTAARVVDPAPESEADEADGAEVVEEGDDDDPLDELLPPRDKKVTREEALLASLPTMTLDDLTIEIARAMVSYTGKGKNTLRTRWEAAIQSGDLEDSRKILRFILTGEA